MQQVPALTLHQPGPRDHRDRRDEIGHARQQSHRERRQPMSLEHQRQPDRDAVDADPVAEQYADHHPDARVAKHGAEIPLRQFGRFARKHVGERGGFLPRQPVGLFGAVAQQPQRQQAEQTSRQPFDDEQPRPALEPRCAVELHDERRQHTAHDRRQRNRDQKPREHAHAPRFRKPARQIEQHAGKESGFGRPGQHAKHVEARRPLDERTGGGQQPPADHDARQPAPRTEPIEREIARHLERAIADEEQAGRHAELAAGQAEIAIHRQRREADVGPIDVVEEIADRQQRDEADQILAQRALQCGVLRRIRLLVRNGERRCHAFT
ncbi:hypothetical protein FEP54_04522 [Burkholderia multivorans]|nr:hypothetical protein [Burkholderia multivorans]MDR8925790.1 hypothetical protein [Burkholderia multivorans]MDR8969429.1 hypothetical protein [Burkholderia multivorans]MDR8991999.1 hypothetical protein [Burkholderia multivorans]